MLWVWLCIAVSLFGGLWHGVCANYVDITLLRRSKISLHKVCGRQLDGSSPDAVSRKVPLVLSKIVQFGEDLRRRVFFSCRQLLCCLCGVQDISDLMRCVWTQYQHGAILERLCFVLSNLTTDMKSPAHRHNRQIIADALCGEEEGGDPCSGVEALLKVWFCVECALFLLSDVWGCRCTRRFSLVADPLVLTYTHTHTLSLSLSLFTDPIHFVY